MKSVQNMMSEVANLRQEVQMGRGGQRPCTSICYRCNKKGHIARNCSKPAPNGVMCITGYDTLCTKGGSHACECGSCHWDTGHESGK